MDIRQPALTVYEQRRSDVDSENRSADQTGELKSMHLRDDEQPAESESEHGPHVVKGGKCMTPPTPGTENYEEVLFGKVYMPKQEAPKEFRETLPSAEIAYTVLVPEVDQEK